MLRKSDSTRLALMGPRGGENQTLDLDQGLADGVNTFANVKVKWVNTAKYTHAATGLGYSFVLMFLRRCQKKETPGWLMMPM